MFDTLDDTFYPDNGIYLRGDIEQLLYTKGRNKSNGSFSVVRGQAVGAMPMAKNLTFIGGLEAGFVLGRQHTRTMDFLLDRKSTRLNSSHVAISYAVFC